MISELRSTRSVCQRWSQPGGSERRPQPPHASQCFQEVAGPWIARGKTQSRHPARSHQLGRYYEQALAQTLQRSSLQVGRNTESLEPIQQVVSQQGDLEERLVGLEVVRRNLAQGVGVLQFPDDGSTCTKVPNAK